MQESINFLKWINKNKYHLYKDGLLYSTKEYNFQKKIQKYYTEEQLFKKYIEENEIN